jgi:uncharacterized protein
MSQVESRVLVEAAFHQSRQRFQLGIDELQAALDAIASIPIATIPISREINQIEGILRLLWCHSRRDRDSFTAIWQQVWQQVWAEQPLRDFRQPATPDIPEGNLKDAQPAAEATESIPPELDAQTVNTTILNRFEALPVQAPPNLAGDEAEIRSDFPVTRRSLSYGWRLLRRLRADGVRDVVDVEATIQQVAKQGFYLAPVLQRQEVNHARLLLLVDQQGSMVPFHRFSRDLVETAQEDGTIADVQVCYFHNVPRDYVYIDEHLTQPIELAQVLRWCDGETSVMIISDAGAARGNRRLARIRETTQFLTQLLSHTRLVGWLNPLPRSRWARTAAEILAYLVRMETMNQDGFSTMIQEVRGVPLAFWSRSNER